MTLHNLYNTHSKLSHSNLYGDIADCYDFQELETVLLNSLTEKIGADTSALLHFKQDDGDLQLVHDLAQGVHNKIHSQYTDKFYREDPILTNRKMISTFNKKSDALADVYRLSDVCEKNEFIKTDYYNDFLKPSGIRHVLALAIRPKLPNGNLLVLLGFHRSAGQSDFSERAIRKAINVAPIIGSTVARITFKEQLSDVTFCNENLRLALGKTGYLVLDDSMQILEASDSVLSNKYGELPFLMQNILQGVQSLNLNALQHLKVNCKRKDSARTRLNENICINIKRLATTGEPLRFIVQVGFVHSSIAIARCKDAFSWTNREAEIVMALAQGLSNTQISDLLVISIRTVENHLRSIYCKANVSSRTQLLRQLLHDTPAHH
ncbi:MAG: hypothetical protein COA74_02085 [Gammaproteobacteria bacterium]|nr:MAG: hypothetical protein COA74_02085 [Gammaproteobacteria bacterium]